MTKLKILDRLLIGFAALAVIYIISVSDIFATFGQNVKNAPVNYKLEEVAGGLSHPWSLAFLPDGDMLVSERDGRLSRIAKKNRQGAKHPKPAARHFLRSGRLARGFAASGFCRKRLDLSQPQHPRR